MIKNITDKIKIESEKIDVIFKELEQEVPLYVNHINSLNAEVAKSRVEKKLKNVEENLDIKKIYRIIKSKTHPDKTDDPRLNQLFIEATIAYRSYNYNTLFNIFSNFDKEVVFERKNKLELLKEQLDNLKNEYNNFSKTAGYNILRLIENNEKSKARKLFLEALFNKIIELEELIKRLK
jgi:hypothetical protein